MARKRGVFFHPIFTFLRTVLQQLIRQWAKALSAAQRSVVVYVFLAAFTALICAIASPGFARVTVATPTANSIAQATPTQSEAQQLEQQGNADYETGRFSEAVAAFKQAADLHQQSGNLEQAAIDQINQAKALQALGLYNQAIVVLQTALTPEQQTLLLQDLQGEIRCSEKNRDRNSLWKRLEDLPDSSTNAATIVAALRGLGDALQVTGDLEQSCTILHYSLQLTETWSLTDAIAPTYLSLGNLIRTQAIAELRLKNLNPEQAIVQLRKQKQLSPIQQELQRRRTEAAEQFMKQTAAALEYYQRAGQQAANDAAPLIQAQAQLNTLSLFLDRTDREDREKRSEAAAATPPLYPLLNSLSQSRSAIETRINLAQSLMRLAEGNVADQSSDFRLQAAQLLAAARQQASELGNAQAESYALGSLGELYEQAQRWTEAETLTQQALEKVNGVSAANVPHTINDVDLAYRWYYQLGRIREKCNKISDAIDAYEAAVTMLQEQLRLDVASSNLNYRSSFREEAQEPVHRELMKLLLQPEIPSQDNLKRVREVSTSLLEVELTSFLQRPCTVTTPRAIDEIIQQEAPQTAVFYPVVLPDSLDVIVKLPNSNKDLFHKHWEVSHDVFMAKLNDLQLALEEDYTFEAVEQLAQQFYDWIIKPAEAELKKNQIDTLVFTLDRQLQSIPMSVLYDGEKYLIEKYAISEILGLNFDSSDRLDRSNRPDRPDRSLQPNELKIMAAGLSEIPPSLPKPIRDNFQPLNYVDDELGKIEALRDDGIKVVTLKNNKFTVSNFNTRLNEDKFSVIHLATHGQFSVNPQSTFLLTSGGPTGESTNGLIRVNDLADLFRTRGQIRLDAIELLVLNACETAAGDELATLGLAGTAVRAGARSAIASLWVLDDELSVGFTKTLYEKLRQPDFTKAKALQQAQRELLRDPQHPQYRRHPRYWSPYVLAGNWLPLTSSSSIGSTGSSPSN